MDVTTMTLAELETALAKVIESEDVFGHPDIHTEDHINDEIARRKVRNGAGISIFA